MKDQELTLVCTQNVLIDVLGLFSHEHSLMTIVIYFALLDK